MTLVVENYSFHIMPSGDSFQFYPYNYHLICVQTSTFTTLHACNCLSKCLKIITCFKKQKFSLNQFKLLPSTGMSYRWTSRGASALVFPCRSSDGTPNWNFTTI